MFFSEEIHDDFQNSLQKNVIKKEWWFNLIKDRTSLTAELWMAWRHWTYLFIYLCFSAVFSTNIEEEGPWHSGSQQSWKLLLTLIRVVTACTVGFGEMQLKPCVCNRLKDRTWTQQCYQFTWFLLLALQHLFIFPKTLATEHLWSNENLN